MINVFEAFSGYGSQSMALRNLGIDHCNAGISEIDENAILSYAAIHTDFLKEKDVIEYPSDEEMRDYLRGINAPLDYKTFEFKGDKLKGDRLKNIWLACIMTKNKGDISKVNPNDLVDIDLFTYSFPCQDISIAGNQKGLEEGVETRSSLLWECCKIIEDKKPKFLLMENVKNLVSKKHKPHFDKFLEYLEGQGYTNHWKVLNAKDYGVPQNRERVFVVSILNGEGYEFPTKKILCSKVLDFINETAEEKYYFDKDYHKVHKLQEMFGIEDRKRVVYGSIGEPNKVLDIVPCITTRFVSSGIQAKPMFGSIILEGDRIRRLEPVEVWRLMGCTDGDFHKAEEVNSNTQLYKQAGNSIVVTVLEYIFGNLPFKKKYKLK